uniref:Ribonuclease H1 N-terminal domain-containing protein n=1 Tax=Timema poppense TaxID=170557 RepID=A0A7R9HG75_TIMPO|nr:unnamed protein product [Timema poppensis]
MCCVDWCPGGRTPTARNFFAAGYALRLAVASLAPLVSTTANTTDTSVPSLVNCPGQGTPGRDSCKEQVNKFPNQKYKKFSTIEEANKFIEDNKAPSPDPESVRENRGGTAYKKLIKDAGAQF